MVSARHSHDNESLFVPVPPTEEKQLFGPAPTRKKKRSQCFVQAPGTRTHGRKKKTLFCAGTYTEQNALDPHGTRTSLVSPALHENATKLYLARPTTNA